MTITYEFDIAPHLARAGTYRWKRKERYAQLHAHDGRGLFWRITIPSLLLFWALLACGVSGLL